MFYEPTLRAQEGGSAKPGAYNESRLVWLAGQVEWRKPDRGEPRLVIKVIHDDTTAQQAKTAAGQADDNFRLLRTKGAAAARAAEKPKLSECASRAVPPPAPAAHTAPLFRPRRVCVRAPKACVRARILVRQPRP